MLVTIGTTKNFIVQYNDSFPGAIPRAQALLITCEADLQQMLGIFGVPASAFGPSFPITTINEQRNGAFNLGYNTQHLGMRIIMDSFLGIADDGLANEGVRMLFAAELAEILMNYLVKKGKTNWNMIGSDGEALSNVMAAVFSPRGYYGTGWGPRVNSWFDSAGRDTSPLNWVDKSEASDTNIVSFGCGILFLYYMHSQLGYSWLEIVQSKGSTMEDHYASLVGGKGGYDAFIALLDQFFPVGNAPVLATDDPFPLLGPDQRYLGLNLQSSPTGSSLVLGSGKTDVWLLGCGRRKYDYTLSGTPQKLVCQSHTIGFGNPSYSWTVNGVKVPVAGGQIKPTAVVTQLPPNDPLNPIVAQAWVKIDCSVQDDTTSSELTMTFGNLTGQVDLAVELDAIERFASTDVSSIIKATTVNNEVLTFEAQYHKDLASCFSNFVNKIPRKLPNFLWQYLPDPPPYATQVIRELQAIGHQLEKLSAVAPAQTQVMVETLARKLNVDQGALRGLMGVKADVQQRRVK